MPRRERAHLDALARRGSLVAPHAARGELLGFMPLVRTPRRSLTACMRPLPTARVYRLCRVAELMQYALHAHQLAPRNFFRALGCAGFARTPPADRLERRP